MPYYVVLIFMVVNNMSIGLSFKAIGGIIGVLLVVMFLTGHIHAPDVSSLSVSNTQPNSDAKLIITDVTGLTNGFVWDDDNNKIKFTDDDLTSGATTELNFTIKMKRNDDVRDVDGAGYIFKFNADGMKAYSSYNSSVTDKLHAISYDESSDEYSIDIAGVSSKDLPYRIEAKQGVTYDVPVSIDIADLDDMLNIVEHQYDSIIAANMPVGSDSLGLEFTRTSAEA